MTHRSFLSLVVAAACVGAGCRLKPPEVVPARMIEPRLIETLPPAGIRSDHAVSVRLLSTEARGHIGRRLLHQRAGGELVEDEQWRWTSAPDRYLDMALRLALESSPEVRLVEAGNVTVLAVTLLEWHLESADTTQLVGAIDVEITGTDRIVHTYVLHGKEQVSAPLPGDLAAAAGRLLQALASQSVARTLHAVQ